jgi:hypothetical protein
VRIIESSGLPVGALQPVSANLAPPKELALSRRKMSFMIMSESLRLQTLHGTRKILFKYTSETPLSVDLQVGHIHKTSKLVRTGPITYTEGELEVPSDLEGRCRMEVSQEQQSESIVIALNINDDSITVESMSLCLNGATTVDLLKLYGCSGTAEVAVGSETNDSCSICLSEQACVGFLPCRHVCVCPGCADATLRSSENRCPICRQYVHGILRLTDS